MWARHCTAVIVAAKNESGSYTHINIAPPKELKVVAAIPDYELKTKAARNVLPEQYPKEDVIHALSHAALLVGALLKGELSVLADALDDRIHQPYRKSLMPGFEELQETVKDHGAYGVVISGAGPTMLALAEGETRGLMAHMDDVLQKHGVRANILELPVDHEGALCKKMEVGTSVKK